MSLTVATWSVTNGALIIDATVNAPTGYKIKSYYVMCGSEEADFVVPVRNYYTGVVLALTTGRNVSRIPLSMWPNGDLTFTVRANYTNLTTGATLEETETVPIAVTNTYYQPKTAGFAAQWLSEVQNAPIILTFAVPTLTVTSAIEITLAAEDNAAVSAYMITESATAPSASDPRWATSAPTSYVLPTLGINTLYGWAKDAEGNVSDGIARTVNYYVPTVTASPAPGTYSAAQTVTLTRSNFVGGNIYYTLDGSDPTTESAAYTDPITVTESTTLKVLAVDADGNQGEVQTFAYSIMQLSAVVNVPTTQLALASGSVSVLAVKNNAVNVSGSALATGTGVVRVETSNNRIVTIPSSVVLSIASGIVTISTTRSISVGIPTQNVLSIVTGQVVVASSAIGNVVIPVTGQDQNLLTGLVSIITNQVSGGRIRDKDNRTVNFWYWTGSNLAQLNMHI